MADMTTVVQDMARDQFDRIEQRVRRLGDGLPRAAAVWRPDPGANSIAWLLWHLTRIQDDHVAFLAEREQVWTAGGWFERFGLPFPARAHGYGHSSADVAAVQTPVADLVAYHSAVHDLSLAYAKTLTADGLARVVDTNWDPPVTASVRLVSLLGDCLSHVGQAEYVRGLAERAGVR